MLFKKSTALGRSRYLHPAVIAMVALMFSLVSQFSVSEELSLARALQQTLSKNPILQGFVFHEREAEALRLQASIRPAPVVNFSVDNALGSNQFNDANSAEITLGLSQLIELGDKRAARIGLSDARWQSQLANYEIARLETLAETSRRYYLLLEQQALTANLNHREKLERAALKAIKQRQAAGAIGSADSAKMQLRLTQTKMRQLRAKSETQHRKAQLAMMWLGESDFDHLQGSLTALPAVVDIDQLLTRVVESPRYQQKRMLNELALADIEKQRSLNQNDITIGAGVRRFEASNEQAFVFDISTPLTIDGSNRGNLAAAYSRQQWADTEQLLTRKRLSLELKNLAQRLASYRLLTELIVDQQQPEAEQLLREVERGYQQGLYDVLQLVDAQNEVFLVKNERIQLHRQLLLDRLEIERITGQPLLNASNQPIYRQSSKASKKSTAGV